jgi:general secretion pathway protein M
MSGRLASLWAARTPRERWLLGIMLGLVGAVLVWLLILRPLADLESAARERHGAAVEALAAARTQAAAIAALEKAKPATAQGPPEALVGQAAAEAGFQLSRLQPAGEGKVSVSIAAARPQALFGWLAQLEAQRGLIVEQLSTSANADRTLSAEVTLRARRG